MLSFKALHIKIKIEEPILTQFNNDEFKLLDLPYADRQLIVVTNDEIVKESRNAEKQEREQTNHMNWSEIGERVFRVIMGGTGALIIEVSREAYKAWSKARENGVQIIQVGKSESKGLKFPLSHPREGVLYIGHPAEPETYYTIAEFHRITFEHKFCEAINLLMSLGATEISVEHVSGWAKDFSNKIATPIGGAKVDIKIDSNSKSTSQLLFKATLSGTSQPKLPSHLVWYHHEPTWQFIANARIEFGLKEFSLNLSYEDDFGVNAGLKVAVQKAGLELGGKFEDHQSTIWCISGKFKTIEEQV